MNGFYVFVLAATIVAACYYIPKALKYDANLAALEDLDDEEFAAVMEVCPDAKVRWSRW